MIWFAFGTWAHAAGIFFIRTRIYKNGWTPFCKVQKRYKTWFGYWKKWPKGFTGTLEFR